MRVKLNKNRIADVLSKNPKMVKLIKEQVYEIVEQYVEKNKQQMLNEFDSHPVTKEIENGPEASNISNTLDGQGNLFSYIGFDENSNPTEVVREMLNDTRLENKPKISSSGLNIKINFPVIGPRMNEIEAVTPMPFEGGRSWVRGIEKGISGFSYYIFRKFIQSSRSGTGVQTEGQIRTGSFKPTSYLKNILSKFYFKMNSKLDA